MRAEIEETARCEFCGFEEFGLGVPGAENLLARGLGEGGVGGEFDRQFRKPGGKPEPVARRKPVSAVLMGFNEFDRALATPLVIEYPQWARLIEFVNCVASPVPDRQIQPAIAIEITRGDAGPPSCSRGQSPLRGHLLKVSVVIAIDAYRTPFESQCEVGLTIPIQIGKAGAAHQAKRFKRFAQGTVRPQFALAVNPQRGRNRLRMSAPRE